MAATNNYNYILEIEQASFLVKHNTISPSVREAHLKRLQMDTIKYPIKRAVMKYFTRGAARDDLSEQNISEGILPTRIVLGFVNATAFSGNLTENPFNFQHSESVERQYLLKKLIWILKTTNSFGDTSHLSKVLTHCIVTNKMGLHQKN